MGIISLSDFGSKIFKTDETVATKVCARECVHV